MGRTQAEANKNAGTPPLSDIAIRLLQFQQRIAAFDRLYNEEIAGLTNDLTQLKREVVQHYENQRQAEPQAQPATPKSPRPRRKRTAPPAQRTPPPQSPASGGNSGVTAAAQKE